ncbi:hypothetical protein QEN19_001246 [Hanseniaspora menglaensis]
MPSSVISAFFEKHGEKQTQLSLNLEKLFAVNCKETLAYKLLIIPFYAISYLIFTFKYEINGLDSMLYYLSNKINGQGVQFFLSNSKGKSPFLFFANSILIQVFNKISTILFLEKIKVFSPEQIAIFNAYSNIVLFGILLFSLGKYLTLRGTEKNLILFVQFSVSYFIKNQFLNNNGDGLLNVDLIFNNLIMGALLHLNQYNKKKLSDLKNVLLVSLILGILISIKPVSLISGLMYIWILFYWVWQVITIYQFDLNLSTLTLFLYQIAFKIAIMVTVSLALYTKTILFFVSSFEYDEKSFDFNQMSPIFQSSFNSFKNSDGNLIGVPKAVRYMDTVLIKHTDSLGGYLHSHPVPLQTGSGNQQVTIFDSEDMMNEWVLLPGDKKLRHEYLSGNNTEYDTIRKYASIILQHKITEKFLYVHSGFRGPVSEKEHAHEVTCAEFDDGVEDEGNFLFRVEYTGKHDENQLGVVDFEFNLVSVFKDHCKLLSHRERLPSWGFFQQEVICMSQAVSQRTSFVIEKIVATTNESLEKMEYRYLNNLDYIQIFKEYLYKSAKKELYDDDMKLMMNTQSNNPVLLSVKEAVFKYSNLSLLHSFTIAAIVLTLVHLCFKAVLIAPLEYNTNWFKNIETLKVKQFRYWTNFIALFLGLILFSLALVKLNVYGCLNETIYQVGIILQILIVSEYLNCFV